MKICGRCGKAKNLDEFTKNKSRKDGLSASCRECHKLYVKRHYSRNTQYYKDKAKNSEKNNREEINKLKSGPCKDCGGVFHPWQMDFDHIGTDKSFTIGKRMYVGRSKLLSEVSKCELVCANCHRHRTHLRLQNTPTGGSSADTTNVC